MNLQGKTVVSTFSLHTEDVQTLAATNRRHEIKFALTLADLHKLRSILEVNCRRVVFNRMATDVSSIYFDDHALSACHESIDGVERRGKLRLRWYDARDTRFFFENKLRLGNVIEKRRFAIESTQPLGSMSFGNIVSELARVLPPHDAELIFFRPEPVLTTCYKREHFTSRDTSIRVTLDYDIRCFDQFGARRLRTRFGVPVAGLVVIEAKAPPGAETDLPRLIAPLRPVLTKSSKYVTGCRLLGLLSSHFRDPYE